MVAKKPRVVIVGAGMAGLTAAHRLQTAAGGLFDLCVVEGGDRIGGRILTSEFAGDRVEMGATWIHGIGGSPVHALAAEVGALAPGDGRPWERMDGFPDDPVTVAEGGAVVDPAAVVCPVSALFRRLMDAARTGDAPVPKDLSVGSFLRRGLQDYLSSRRGEGDGWNIDAALGKAVFAMLENTERTYTSADDLKDLDLQAESEYKNFPGDEITIAGGYSRIVEALAAVLPPGAIRFRRRLRRVEWCPDASSASAVGPVRLHFDGGDPMAADHVIVTVSLGVLKAGLGKDGGGVMFSPPLPDSKEEAIGRLGFGVVNKLFMEMDGGDDPAEAEGLFRFPFLQMAFDQGEGEDAKSPRHVAAIPRWMRRTATMCPIYGGSRVLLAWLAGKEAAELEALTDEEVVRGAQATLDAFTPRPSPNVLRRCNGSAAAKKSGPNGTTVRIGRVKRSRWVSDPLFLGSYSYVAVGSSGDDQDRMAEPLPRCRGDEERDNGSIAPSPSPPLQILFAGEATHRTHYSTTHGAYFSGIREANRLLQYYRYTSSLV